MTKIKVTQAALLRDPELGEELTPTQLEELSSLGYTYVDVLVQAQILGTVLMTGGLLILLGVLTTLLL